MVVTRNRPVNNDKWPAGLAELVNSENRVHGYFVNWEDVFFFRGDTAGLNQFLAKYSTLPAAKLELIVHAGKLEVKSPWDKQPREIVANWRLYTSPFEREQLTANGLKPGDFVTRVDVWLGDAIKLTELQVPQNVSVKSGGEIERFVEQHAAPTTAPAGPRD